MITSSDFERMGSRYEHIREISLDRTGTSVRFILETASPEINPAADQFCQDVAASLAMYANRLEPFPAQIRIQFDDAPAASAGPERASGAAAPALMEKVRPRFTLEEFICYAEFRRVLDDVLFYAQHYPEIRGQMGVESVTRSFLVNFHGASGTGKTMAAEALARELGKDLYVMNFANVESSLLGRTPKNISRAFREIDPASALLMLDEADAFVSRRIADLRQGAEYALNTARGQIINEIDRFDGTIILATNLFGTYDNAIMRRIKFNLLFEPPGRAAIEQMFRRFLSGAAGLPELDFDRLAAAATGLSGGDVYNLSEIIVMKALQSRQTGGGELDSLDIEAILAFYCQKTRAPGSVRLSEPPAENAPSRPV